MAYTSDESGRNEVYVVPFFGPGGKSQISADGGGGPLWSRNGRELFYVNGTQMMAVDVETDPTFRPGTPRLLFDGGFQPAGLWRIAPGDVTADGQRFLMVQVGGSTDSGAAPASIIVVLNFF